ncbi:hypothetical protein [Pyxidicoccus caerfyrddinensis]|uniref:hypothetical protein n=1 Tax=Pyxidicoccus caerfyrddinensis TaxID=2709663 RepID=UPI0013D9FAFF|nr:hypothetical protein [Pyxidicoccus caerfyrddinensis]
MARTTIVEGKPLKKNEKIHSQLQREFKEGDKVRTSFDVQKQKKTSNVAKSIDKSENTNK